MGTRTFEGFGSLEYLEPADFYTAPWTFVVAATADEDDEDYSIVRLGFVGYRYTNI